MITDNRFTADSIVVHTERLLLMQQNFGGHALAFSSMNPAPLSWAADCYTDYQSKRVAAAHNDAQVRAATTATRLAFRALKAEYVAVRDYARQLFANDRMSFEAHKFNIPYPEKQISQIERVSSLLAEHASRVAANESKILPVVLITALTNAFEAANIAYQTKSNVRTEANHARLSLQEKHKTDIQNLKLLYSFATAVWNENDVHFNDLGFARPDQITQAGKGSSPKSPTGIRFNGSSLLEWNTAHGATSYGVSVSTDKEDWQPDITTQSNSATVPTSNIGKLYYRVRARNANGFGEYSTTFERLFGLPVVESFNYDLGQLSWEEGEFAETYEVERAVTGTNIYTRIYTGSGVSTMDTSTNDSRTYRIRAVNGMVKSDWVELDVMQE